MELPDALAVDAQDFEASQISPSPNRLGQSDSDTRVVHRFLGRSIRQTFAVFHFESGIFRGGNGAPFFLLGVNWR
jgi:hypothetical protein